MIEFLNNALSKIEVHHSSLYPIYVDIGIINDHYTNFSSYLQDSIEDYFESKNIYSIYSEEDYSFTLYFKERLELPVICNKDYNEYIFFIEFLNIKSKRAILFGIEKDSSHINVCFYKNYNVNNLYMTTKKVGELTLVSNMMNNGVGIHLLNILYEFMENDHFDQEDPFYRIAIN